MTDWCILRMAAPRTLAVVKSLASAGLEVWTPIETRPCRKGRSRDRAAKAIPVLATFAFAKAQYLPELIRIREDPVSPHPDFSVFHHRDGIPLISDRDLDALRDFELTAARAYARKLPREMLKTGTHVRVSDDAFAGLNGVVLEESKGKFVMVAFPGWAIPVQIAQYQLRAIPHDAA